MENAQPIYEKRGVPRLLNIKGYDLFYKDPPTKDEYYVYRCRKKNWKYLIKINKDNIQKITNKDNVIEFKEFNKHTNHEELIDLNNELIDPSKARTEKENINLAIYLIKNNIKEDLDFNFYKNKIFWKKSKISKYIFNIREQKFPKDELFLNSIYTIKIKLAHNEFTEENFCIFK